MASAFIRRPNETNADLVMCRCAKCEVLIGVSPSYVLMKVMENLHKCAQAKKLPPGRFK